MDLTIISEFIIPITLVVCVGVGYIIKTSLDFIPNKYIPLIMGIVGVLFNIWSSNYSVDATTIASGLITGLASTGMYELFRNFIEKK